MKKRIGYIILLPLLILFLPFFLVEQLLLLIKECVLEAFDDFINRIK